MFFFIYLKQVKTVLHNCVIFVTLFSFVAKMITSLMNIGEITQKLNEASPTDTNRLQLLAVVRANITEINLDADEDSIILNKWFDLIICKLRVLIKYLFIYLFNNFFPLQRSVQKNCPERKRFLYESELPVWKRHSSSQERRHFESQSPPQR